MRKDLTHVLEEDDDDDEIPEPQTHEFEVGELVEVRGYYFIYFYYFYFLNFHLLIYWLLEEWVHQFVEEELGTSVKLNLLLVFGYVFLI